MRIYFIFWIRPVAHFFCALMSLRYKVIITGADVLKSPGRKLFIPNHQALIDPIILLSHTNRYSVVNPAVTDKYFTNFFFKVMLKLVNAIPVSDNEAGRRDPDVLQKVFQSVFTAFKKGNDIIIYPSGQLASQGFEVIRNKQGVYKLIPELPADVKIIGVRISGLWGSMWSRAKTGKTPDFLTQLLKGIGIIFLNLIFFVPRRKVNFEFVDLTVPLKEYSQMERREFNQYLEEFYNRNGEEKLLRKKYFFFI